MKLKTIIVSFPHFDPNSSFKHRYRVERVKDSVEFSPGQFLVKTEIEMLCKSKGWCVTIQPPIK